MGDTAFGDISQFGQSDGEEVIRDGKRLPVKVSAGDDPVFIGEDGGVVRDGIDFGQQYGGNVADGVFRGTMYLRDAAEGVGSCTCACGRSISSLPASSLRKALPSRSVRVRAYLLDTVHKRVDASVEGFERKGGYQVSFLGEAEGFENGKYTVGTHELGTVEQCKPFLAHEPDGFPAKFVEHADGFALSFLYS